MFSRQRRVRLEQTAHQTDLRTVAKLLEIYKGKTYRKTEKDLVEKEV